jgi:hypothetical protein
MSPGVLKVAFEYDNKTFLQELFKILRYPSRKWAVKIENFEKKIHGRVRILGWSKKQHGNFSGSKLLADSKNVHVLYVWSSHNIKSITYPKINTFHSAFHSLPKNHEFLCKKS